MPVFKGNMQERKEPQFAKIVPLARIKLKQVKRSANSVSKVNFKEQQVL
jgi:hypothetical protein